MKHIDFRKLVLALALLVPTGCVQQYMANQPKFKPLQATSLFSDGRTSRPLEAGTVSRNYRDDPHLMQGLKATAPKGMVGVDVNTPQALAAGALGGGPLALLVATAEQNAAQPMDPMSPPPIPAPDEGKGKAFVGKFADNFPMVVDAEVMKRGQQRYNVFCSVCHGYAGSGDGMIVKRGFTMPPSLVNDNPVVKENYSRGIAYQGTAVLLTDAPVGYYFHVISNGYGAMPEHATQIPVEDRWAIASYLRALQLSQRYSADKVKGAPDDVKKKIDEALKHSKHEGGAK